MFMQSSFVGEYKFTGQYYPVRVEIVNLAIFKSEKEGRISHVQSLVLSLPQGINN